MDRKSYRGSTILNIWNEHTTHFLLIETFIFAFLGAKKRYSDGKYKKSNWRVIVNGLDERTSWQDLKNFMTSAGPVIYATVDRPRDREGVYVTIFYLLQNISYENKLLIWVSFIIF